MTEKINPLKKLQGRLLKIGINIIYVANIPWIYLNKINNKNVMEKTNDSNYGFVIALLPIHKGDVLHLVNTKEAFKLIRKYINNY